MTRFARPVAGRLVFGVAMLTIGLVWTLDNIGYAEAGHVLRWWPVALVTYGVMVMGGIGCRRNLFWGSFILFAGMLMLLGAFGVLHAGLDVLWPLFLIAIGIKVLTRAAGARAPESGPGYGAGGEVEVTEERDLRAFAAMGGVIRRARGSALERAELSAVMGGVELDLREATPASGRVDADVFAVWGGVVILVPESWRVESEVSAVMASVQDETRHVPGEGPPVVLVLRGTVVMAGVEVRNERSADFRGVRVGVTRMRRERGEGGERGAGPRVVANVYVGDPRGRDRGPSPRGDAPPSEPER